ncbi:MAG: caspase family protein [Clostridia bacterium]|nr:caspase family protein [Clostridia bacterium]
MARRGKYTGFLAFLCGLVLLFFLVCPALAEDVPPPHPRMRAMLVGCDHFLSQPDTGSAADNNVQMLSDILLTDSRHYALIRSYSSSLSSVDAFAEAVENTFQNAQPHDISLLYIASHGVMEKNQAAFLLSDGQREALLNAETLERILNRIPGTKIVILDGCYAGAMIGKGVSPDDRRTYLSGPDYKVLCSAGGSEASWYWQGTENAAASGASYFATVLAYGLGMGGEPAADDNRDGVVTVKEAYVYLCANYAAATPQIYPVSDEEIPLFTYSGERHPTRLRAVTDITFEDTLLIAGQSEVTFAFTVQRQVALYYQIVYHQDGAWQFAHAQHYLDGEQLDGSVLPGRKMRTLSLNTGPDNAYGYAMIQLITLEGGRPVFQGSRLLCVQPAVGEIQLSVKTEESFCPAKGEELCVLALHDVPCGLTVSILDEEGHTVRRLAYETPSRPQQLTPAGSTFYWDGRMTNGETAPAGVYRAQVKTRLNGQSIIRESEPFRLSAPREALPYPMLYYRERFKTIWRCTK